MDTNDHEAFAKETNGEVWRLLEKTDRTPADDEQMIHAAHASCYHWLFAGTPLHHQRGEWLIARAYTALGHREAAERHTRRCLALTESHRDLMQDFDLAFAHELAARTAALVGGRPRASLMTSFSIPGSAWIPAFTQEAEPPASSCQVQWFPVSSYQSPVLQPSALAAGNW